MGNLNTFTKNNCLVNQQLTKILRPTFGSVGFFVDI